MSVNSVCLDFDENVSQVSSTCPNLELGVHARAMVASPKSLMNHADFELELSGVGVTPNIPDLTRVIYDPSSLNNFPYRNQK